MKVTQILPLASIALGATIDVTVGPGLYYSPDSVTAAKGDVVRFKFGSGHNVVSGNYNSPCQPNGMIFSGYPSDGQTFSVTLNNTDPIWIYCSVSRHCEGGMAMVINPPSNENITAYKSAASSVSSSGTPSSVMGGVLNANSASSSGMSSATSSMSMSMSTSRASSTSASGASSMMSSATSSASASATSHSSAGKVIGSSSLVGAVLAALAMAF